MIRITIQHTADDLLLKVEGSLIEPWVRELEASWDGARPTLGGRRLHVDLRGVCQVDDGGRELMARLHADGARFVTSGCVMPEVVREIAANRMFLERI